MSLQISCVSGITSSTKVGDRVAYDFTVKNQSLNKINGPFLVYDSNRGNIDLKIESLAGGSSIRKTVKYSIKDTDILTKNGQKKITKNFSLTAGGLKSNNLSIEKTIASFNEIESVTFEPGTCEKTILKNNLPECNLPIQRGSSCGDGACSNLVVQNCGNNGLQFNNNDLAIWEGLAAGLETCPDVSNGIYVAAKNDNILRIPVFESGQITGTLKDVLADLYLFYNCDLGKLYFLIKARPNTILSTNSADTFVRNQCDNQKLVFDNSTFITNNNNEVIAFEGCISLPAGSVLPSVQFHVNSTVGQTLSTGKDEFAICLQMPDCQFNLDATLEVSALICGNEITENTRVITGTEVEYTFKITNTGDERLIYGGLFVTNIGVLNKAVTIFGLPGLAPGEMQTQTTKIIYTPSGIYQPIFTLNIVGLCSNSSKDLQLTGKTIEVEDFVPPTLIKETLANGQVLTGDCSKRFVLAGTEITWRYTVTSSNFPVEISSLTDSDLGNLLDNGPVTISANGSSLIIEKTGTAVSGLYENTANLTYKSLDLCELINNQSSVKSCYFGASPDLKVELCVQVKDCTTGAVIDCIHPTCEEAVKLLQSNNQATLKVTVTNTGNVSLENINFIAQPSGANVGLIGSLNPNEVIMFTYMEPLSNNYSIQASTSFQDTVGQTVQVQANDQLCFTTANPSLSLNASCSDELLSPLAASVSFSGVITNTGNVPLVLNTCQISDLTLNNVTLAVGENRPFTVTKYGPFNGQAVVDFTVCLAATYQDLFCNKWISSNRKVTCQRRVGSLLNLRKSTNGNCGSQEWSFELHEFNQNSSLESFTTGNGVCEKTFTTLLDPLKTYSLIELIIPAGWSAEWTCNGNQVVPISTYNNNGSEYILFGAGTECPLSAGNSLLVNVNNVGGNGQARTPGYWKNWNQCANGNQVQVATKNGGPAEGFYILNDLLPLDLYNCIVNGPEQYRSFGFLAEDVCGPETKKAIAVLDQRDVVNNKKNANDAAYTLAMHLLATLLNYAAGAQQLPQVTSTINIAQDILCQINFQGTGTYLRPKDSLYDQALTLAGILDQYNNNQL